jgi:hypothetical protein
MSCFGQLAHTNIVHPFGLSISSRGPRIIDVQVPQPDKLTLGGRWQMERGKQSVVNLMEKSRRGYRLSVGLTKQQTHSSPSISC